MPGHSGWQYGRPDLVACPTYEAFGGCARALDMTKDSLYPFLKGFFLEIANLFPDPVINFCGDEVRFECLDSNPAIKAWAAVRNMSYFELEQYFWTRMNEKDGVIQSLRTVGKVAVVSEGSSAAQGTSSYRFLGGFLSSFVSFFLSSFLPSFRVIFFVFWV